MSVNILDLAILARLINSINVSQDYVPSVAEEQILFQKVSTKIEFYENSQDIQLLSVNNSDTNTSNLFKIISFRGSDSDKDWRDDMEFAPVTPSRGDKNVRVHQGIYNKYLSCQDYIETLLDEFLDGVDVDVSVKKKIYITGHSLGGGLSNICAYMLKNNPKYSDTDIRILTMGAPLVGNGGFVEFLKNNVPHNFGLINDADVVPMMPPIYKNACSTMIYFINKSFLYKIPRKQCLDFIVYYFKYKNCDQHDIDIYLEHVASCLYKLDI